MEPLEEEPDQDLDERYPEELIHDDAAPEVPDDDPTAPEPAAPPPEPTSG